MNHTHSSAREILHAATVDAMNRYVNQVLIPAKVIDDDTWSKLGTGIDSEVMRKKHEIAKDIAEKWQKAFGAALEKG